MVYKIFLFTYPSKSSTMRSSSSPPKIRNFLILHTCDFSNLPNFIFLTMAGRFSFKVRNCGGLFVCADQREDWSLGQSTSIFLKIKTIINNIVKQRNLTKNIYSHYHRLRSWQWKRIIYVNTLTYIHMQSSKTEVISRPNAI